MSKNDKPTPKPQPAQSKPATPPPDAFWNGIRRMWMVDRDGEAVALDPQPPPPPRVAAHVPPAAKVLL